MSVWVEPRARVGADRSGARFSGFAASRGLAVGMVLFAMAQQSLGHHNADNSWLIDLCEKILDGARPYIDAIETNPPGAFLLYMPAVFLARALHLPAEFVVSACVFAATGGCVFLAGKIAREAGLTSDRVAAIMGNAAIFALVLTPGFSFAEREHVAAFCVLPVLAVYAARAGDFSVRAGLALAAGLLAGLAMAIKPHFALAVALPLLVVLGRRRSLAPAFRVENFAAAAVVLAYIAVTFLYFPAFLDVLPSIVDAYVPVKEPIALLIAEPWCILNIVLLAAAAFAAARTRDFGALLLAAASAGFLLAYFVQGKGWVNHGLPGDALAFLALVLALAPALAAGFAHPSWPDLRLLAMFILAPPIIGMPILFGAIVQLTMRNEYEGLVEAVRRVAPTRPKLIAVSGDLDVGHPLARRVGGVWAGRPHSLWLMLSAQLLIDARRGDGEKLAGYVARDGRMFAEDVRGRKPDVILVGQGERVELMLKNPDIASALGGYEYRETAGGVAIWTPAAR